MNNENDHKDFVVRTIHKYNYYEPLISIIFLKLLTKNDIFIDIGGNIGFYSLLTWQNCKEVHSFEHYMRIILYLNKIFPVIDNKNIISDKEHSMVFS